MGQERGSRFLRGGTSQPGPEDQIAKEVTCLLITRLPDASKATSVRSLNTVGKSAISQARLQP
jgi:hypothetical protein